MIDNFSNYKICKDEVIGVKSNFIINYCRLFLSVYATVQCY